MDFVEFISSFFFRGLKRNELIEEVAMSAESSEIFTLKEINRIQILQDVIGRRISSGRAAELFGVTPRHCSRLLNRHRENGPLSISNRSCGNPGNRLLPKAFTDQALEIIKGKYSDFGPTLYPTLRLLFVQFGIDCAYWPIFPGPQLKIITPDVISTQIDVFLT